MFPYQGICCLSLRGRNSRGWISVPCPIGNSHIFPNTMSVSPNLRKEFGNNFTFLETTTTYEKQMTRSGMILKHLCLSGMAGIIQSKITWFWRYILLPLLCSMSLISPKLADKSIIFSQIWPFLFTFLTNMVLGEKVTIFEWEWGWNLAENALQL